MDFKADITREADLFGDCLVSDVAKNLIAIFLKERSAGRLPRIKGIAPTKPQKEGMLGGGVMGSSIVHLLLSSGLGAVLWEVNDQALAKGGRWGCANACVGGGQGVATIIEREA